MQQLKIVNCVLHIRAKCTLHLEWWAKKSTLLGRKANNLGGNRQSNLGGFMFRQEIDHKCLVILLFYISKSLLNRSNKHLLSICFPHLIKFIFYIFNPSPNPGDIFFFILRNKCLGRFWDHKLWTSSVDPTARGTEYWASCMHQMPFPQLLIQS